jgi:signal transduction histidine kinase
VTVLTRLLASTPFRLAIVYMGAFVVATALVIGYLVWQANQFLTSRAAEALALEEASLRSQYRAGGALRLVAAVDARVNAPGAGLYLLLDGYGNRLAGNLPRQPEALAEDGRPRVFFYQPFSEAGSDAGRERLAIGSVLAVPGRLTLVVARDIDDQRQLASGISRMALWGFGLLSVLGVAAGILIGRGMVARIEAITDTSRRIMAGDLSRRVPLSGWGDEVDRLAEGLNAMLARIEELLAALREVSDNIAHDLKTPLNRLRNRAEAALRSSDPAAYREGLSRTIEEADELIKTFNSLLLIARLEAGAAAETMMPVDLAGVIGDIAELYEPAAEEAGLTLVVSAKPGEPGLCAVANRELVSQAVANLVDNAIKYSAAALATVGAGDAAAPAPPPEIRITLARVGDAVEIAVGDRGPGIAAPDRERALQRFVRLEKSRSRPGAGLGLSLVAAVARMHGGSVRLEDNEPGLRAVLSIPTHRAAPARPAGSSGAAA